MLESGFNVLFADLDALFLRSPAPILADGDIIGERIWGRPLSVVKKWGAAICTGFYFVRSTPRTLAIFRKTQSLIVAKRLKQPRWQASDQCARARARATPAHTTRQANVDPQRYADVCVRVCVRVRMCPSLAVGVLCGSQGPSTTRWTTTRWCGRRRCR